MPKIGIGGSGNIDNIQMDEQASTPATPAAGKSGMYLKADGMYVIDDEGAVTGPLVSSAGSGYTQGARVHHDAAQTISNNTLTALAFNSERYDTDAIHDPATNNSRLTCQTSGKYIITGNIAWVGNATGERFLGIRLDGNLYIAVAALPTGFSAEHYQSVSTVYHLTASQYLELVVRQQSGGNLDVPSQGNYSPEFSMQRIG